MRPPFRSIAELIVETIEDLYPDLDFDREELVEEISKILEDYYEPF